MCPGDPPTKGRPMCPKEPLTRGRPMCPGDPPEPLTWGRPMSPFSLLPEEAACPPLASCQHSPRSLTQSESGSACCCCCCSPEGAGEGEGGVRNMARRELGSDWGRGAGGGMGKGEQADTIGGVRWEGRVWGGGGGGACVWGGSDGDGKGGVGVWGGMVQESRLGHICGSLGIMTDLEQNVSGHVQYCAVDDRSSLQCGNESCCCQHCLPDSQDWSGSPPPRVPWRSWAYNHAGREWREEATAEMNGWPLLTGGEAY